MFDIEYVRDAAVVAAVFGMAAFAWFGWAQEAPPGSWRVPLGAGAVLGLLVGIAGGVLAVRSWGPETALADPGARRWFGIVAGTEIVLAAAGAAVLAVRGRTRWTAPWICLVVGLHFVPLAVILEDGGLHVLAALLVVVAAAGVVVPRRSSLHPSAVTGAGAGVVLLLFAVRSLVAAL